MSIELDLSVLSLGGLNLNVLFFIPPKDSSLAYLYGLVEMHCIPMHLL